ncbi:hypothetical protein SAMN05421819_1851 [Bryocella elongata]|uniref:Uncharacterized protein n=1 Tax=Bryocella elongata TaxID=863522 RepID=A0A1H5X2N5_9BACT|nr:hypothetical protein [Bryocella elongata]SEG06072.1 hypothetical protein SAMN05421819_1851 [Bryocella elongata]
MQTLLKYLEVVLTAAGVCVVAMVFLVFRDIAPWKAAAICAVVVGVLHGAIFFTVRNSQREARKAALEDIRHKLDDLVRNKLQVVLFASEIQHEDWRPAAQQAVEEISSRLDLIQSEALRLKSQQRTKLTGGRGSTLH